MSNFQESGINFKFQSPKWNVVKYDEHLAHKKVSNALQPTKAVDFLGIHDNRQLFLVEVKNYRGHTHDAETQEVLQAKGEELMRRIAVKVRDTIATVTLLVFRPMMRIFLPGLISCYLIIRKR